MKKMFFMGIVASLLAGCAITPYKGLDSRLESLVEKSETEAIQALGNPNKIHEFGPNKAYVWGNRQTMIFLKLPKHMTENTKTTETGEIVPAGVDCAITLIASAGIVKTWTYDGSVNGCSPYASRLDTYFNR